MTSGVKVSDAVFERYKEMKLGKKHRYMMMTIDGKFIVEQDVVLKTEDQANDFQLLTGRLSPDVCCYILLDLNVREDEGNEKKEVLFLIAWCPDTGKIKDKMLYASSKQALFDKLQEGTKQVQANDFSDLDYTSLKAIGRKTN